MNSYPVIQSESHFSYINTILQTKRLVFIILERFLRFVKLDLIQIPLIHKENPINKLPNLLNEKSHYFLIEA